MSNSLTTDSGFRLWCQPKKRTEINSIQMMHGSEWTLKYNEPGVENVTSMTIVY